MPILYAQRTLQSIVFRPGIISSLNYIGIGAMGVATGRHATSSRSTCGGMASRISNLGWISAGGQARGNEAAKTIADKEIQARIGIGSLELLDRFGAFISHFTAV